jgi:hypothetical protein
MNDRHCETCICGRRAPVQASRESGRSSGTITWAEHLSVWTAYAAKYDERQSAERIAERGGFGYDEIIYLTGKPPTSWEPIR